jgi:hypothetical protein
MGKDLRSTAVSMKLTRHPKLDTSSWGLQNPQPFFPPLEKLFKTDTLSNLSEYGVKLNEEITRVVDETHIETSKGKTVDVHRKTTMILSPFKWMRGDYGVLGLPKPEDVASDMQEKLQSPNGAGYVGALASIALSESDCIHFPKVYGVYVGISSEHTIDISDDYEDLVERKWFGDNLGKTFELHLRNPETQAEFQHTRGQRPGVVLGEEEDLLGVEDVDADHVSNPSSRSRDVSEHDERETLSDEEASSDTADDEYDIESCDCGSEDGSEEEEEEEVDDDNQEPFAWATFRNVPVITTVMEKCEGTYYDLIQNHKEPEKHAAWIAQIVFALAYAQRNYGLAHNDLHGNNVMYVSTEQEHVCYRHNGIVYKVPTHGYIIKIIDFDRATFGLRLLGMKDPKQFVSSQFYPEEEAAGQYNMEPFFTQKHPHIPSNASFDLCRFATSIFWDMFPNGPDEEVGNPLKDVFVQWMTQSDGSSVMFREKRDNHDRYHGFHLYKAIARYCKDAVPRREIAKLTAFRVTTLPLGTPCLFVES